MIRTGPSICGVDTCEHCTPATGCKGIVYREWYAERDLRADAHMLIERGRKYGYAVIVEITRSVANAKLVPDDDSASVEHR